MEAVKFLRNVPKELPNCTASNCRGSKLHQYNSQCNSLNSTPKQGQKVARTRNCTTARYQPNHKKAVLFGVTAANWTYLRTEYSETRLQQHRFIRHLVCNVRYSVVPIYSSLLVSNHIIRHGTTRHDKIFFYGFHMLEFTLVRHRHLTQTVSLGLREVSILRVNWR
jgi:hypothetical protein